MDRRFEVVGVLWQGMMPTDSIKHFSFLVLQISEMRVWLPSLTGLQKLKTRKLKNPVIELYDDEGTL